MIMTSKSAAINIAAPVIFPLLCGVGVASVIRTGTSVACGVGVSVGVGVRTTISGVGVGVGFLVGLTVGIGVSVAMHPHVASFGQSGFLQKPW